MTWTLMHARYRVFKALHDQSIPRSWVTRKQIDQAVLDLLSNMGSRVPTE